MKAQNINIEMKFDGKSIMGKIPVFPPQEGLLNKEQVKAVNKIINNELNDIRRHFRDGAWDLHVGFIVDQILHNVFGTHIEDYITALAAKKCDVQAVWTDKNVKLTNKKEKVFYRPNGNRVYIATQARNVNDDIQLGDL